MRCCSSTWLAAVCLITLTSGAKEIDRRELYPALVGQWTGTLTYRDYRQPDRRVTLPTVLTIRFDRDSAALRFDFTYDDGPGKTVYSHNLVALNPAGTALAWDDTAAVNPETFAVTQASRNTEGTITMVLETEGEDNDAPATLRKTVTIGRDSLRILKTVRPRDGEFIFRNEYVLSRATAH